MIRHLGIGRKPHFGHHGRGLLLQHLAEALPQFGRHRFTDDDRADSRGQVLWQ